MIWLKSIQKMGTQWNEVQMGYKFENNENNKNVWLEFKIMSIYFIGTLKIQLLDSN